jgi:hypothetical protein
MNAGQKDHPTRLEYIAAYGLPHPWLWALVPSGAWALAYLARSSMTETIYIVLRSTFVLLIVWSVFAACLRAIGVRPALRAGGDDAEPPATDGPGEPLTRDSQGP